MTIALSHLENDLSAIDEIDPAPNLAWSTTWKPPSRFYPHEIDGREQQSSPSWLRPARTIHDSVIMLLPLDSWNSQSKSDIVFMGHSNGFLDRSLFVLSNCCATHGDNFMMIAPSLDALLLGEWSSAPTGVHATSTSWVSHSLPDLVKSTDSAYPLSKASVDFSIVQCVRSRLTYHSTAVERNIGLSRYSSHKKWTMFWTAKKRSVD
jgi:hypothetical protein